MAAYTHLGAATSPPPTPWRQLIGELVVASSPTTLTLMNVDGTHTTIFGTGFVYQNGEPVAGVITGMNRTDHFGIVTYEFITELNVSLSTFWNALGDGNKTAWNLLFAGADTLSGLNSFNNILIGGPQGDVHDGGTGVDSASYETSMSAVVADLGNPFNNAGDASGDAYNSIEGLIGSDFNDSLRGNTAANTLRGGLGNDDLRGGDGADVLDGGEGFDEVSFYGPNAQAADLGQQGAYVDLSAGVAIDQFGAIDTLTGIEHARGANLSDTFVGSAGANIFRGLGGADIVIGNLGIDTIAYDRDLDYGGNAGVYVDLANQFAIDGFAAVDFLSGIENARGTGQADTLLGDGSDNELTGDGGADWLFGGGGIDTLLGDEGADVLSGDAGSDLLFGGGGADFIFGGASGDSFVGGSDADWFFAAAIDLSAGVYDYVFDFEDGLDVIALSGWQAGNLLMAEAGGHVIITSSDVGYSGGVIVLNSTLAQAQDQVFVV